MLWYHVFRTRCYTIFHLHFSYSLCVVAMVGVDIEDGELNSRRC